MKPQCVVTVNGKAVTADFLRRLSECEIVDRDGVTSDSVRLRYGQKLVTPDQAAA